MFALVLGLVLTSSLRFTHGDAAGCSVCERLEGVEKSVKDIQMMLSQVVETFSNKKTAKDCAELFKTGIKLSGVYTISPRDGRGPMEVYCDMVTDGGGWTVFQKRLDGSEDFHRGWTDYKLGFGNLNGEFWLGNDQINRLTNQGTYQLRVDLEDTSGTMVYAAYDMFSITSEKTNYQLALGAYSGNAGDSLRIHDGAPFSTKDRDNDTYGTSCAVLFKGAWWYTNCHDSNLNGLYHHGPFVSYADGIIWQDFKGNSYSLKRTSLKIRPAGFKSSKN